MKIKAIDEDGFLQLLREMPANGGSGEAAQKALIKKQEEEEKLTLAIEDLGKALKEKYKNNKIGEKNDLWTTKYDPMDLSEICGNKGQIEKLSNWLDANTLRTRIMGIAKNEGINITPSVSDQLSYGKSAEKSMTLKPFDITARLLSGSTFAENSRISLDEKIKYYFDDHDFTPLMIQENYLNTFPSSVTNGRFASHLDAVAAAADAIADGDLVDKKIRGTQPQWSLMPFHGFMSSIIPSSYIAGQGLGRYNFTGFLGQNSKRNKNIRLLEEFHSHARLSISATHDEVRLQYLPLLMSYKLIDPILAYKEAGIDEVMELMDNYHLTKDDWSVAMDLSVGDKSYATKAKNLSTGMKSMFTRNYNKTSHPVPYMKSAAMFTAKATAATPPTDIPDLVETLGEEREVEVKVEDENDLTKDKYVKETTKPADKKTKRKRRF
ncbi:hypothetical protein D0Z00_000940 [Geotrichum galactomycetum]|uniref:Uncharacterized protein n=1 Tax=Geotrichum galactomycetum TaxID=27317 RepID=A0ACB6V8I3_9ASCO|nr:hypothetical protein D0Z00_000940 [Geotrichum candidum]